MKVRDTAEEFLLKNSEPSNTNMFADLKPDEDNKESSRIRSRSRENSFEQTSVSMEVISENSFSNPETSTKSDSKWRAIIFMNLFCLCVTGVGVTFKKIAAEGVTNLDFGVSRATVGLIGSSIILWFQGTKPWDKDAMPRKHICRLCIRSFMGLSGFMAFTFSL